MSDAFLSSDDFDEQAHQLYNEGRYDEALAVLKKASPSIPTPSNSISGRHTPTSPGRSTPGPGAASSRRWRSTRITRTGWPGSGRRCSSWETGRALCGRSSGSSSSASRTITS